MITGGSTLDPGFPTWGTMLREHGYQTCWYGKWHLTHRDNHWTPERARRARALRVLRRHLPVAERRARARAGASTRTIAAQFEEWFADRGRRSGRGARRSRSSTRTTSPGGTSWTRPRRAPRRSARRSVRRLPPNFETPAAADRARTSRACSARCRRRPRSRSARSPSPAPKRRREVAAVPRPLRASCSARSTARSARVMRDARQPARTWPPTRSSSSPPTTASTAPRTGCAARARRLRGGDPRAADRQGPARRCYSARAERRAHAAHLERRRRAAAADDRARARTTGAREPRYAHIAGTAPTSRAILADPPRAGAAVRRCTRPTRSSPSSRSSPTPPTRRCTSSRVRTPTGEVRDLLALAGARHRAARSAARRASSTTTARTAGASSCTPAPARARWRDRCGPRFGGPSPRSCARPCRRRLREAHGARIRRLLLYRHARGRSRCGPPRKVRTERERGASRSGPARRHGHRERAPSPFTAGEAAMTEPAPSSAWTAR